jgi:Na+-translocating ferredoxin:NAD+ oxidoreductase RnfD subunit
MRSSNPSSLLDWFLLCVPISAIAVWVWGWRTLATVLLGATVVGLLVDAALEGDPNSKDRVLAFLTLTGLMLIAILGLVVAGLVAFTLATLLGVPQR